MSWSKNNWARVRLHALLPLVFVLSVSVLHSCNPPAPAGTVSIVAVGIKYPSAITAGPDGNLWFTNSNSIGRVTPGGVVSIFTDSRFRSPGAIAAGPDGNVWFTNGYNSIGRIDRADHPRWRGIDLHG